MTAPDPGRHPRWWHQLDIRTVLTLVTVGVALDLVISVVLVAFGFALHDANSQASKANGASSVALIANYETCLAGNQFRDENKELWQSVIVLLPTTTPGSRQFVATVEIAIDKTFAHRTCVAPPK